MFCDMPSLLFFCVFCVFCVFGGCLFFCCGRTLTHTTHSAHTTHTTHEPHSPHTHHTHTQLEEDGGPPKLLVVCKGAPEVMEPLLSPLPPTYKPTYKHYAAEGGRYGVLFMLRMLLLLLLLCSSGSLLCLFVFLLALPSHFPHYPPLSYPPLPTPLISYITAPLSIHRVLCLAYKELDPALTADDVRAIRRDNAESALVLAGCAVFQTPLKVGGVSGGGGVCMSVLWMSLCNIHGVHFI